ncbi:MAG: hypothetical protein ACLUVY_03950 [Bacteroides uniformis]
MPGRKRIHLQLRARKKDLLLYYPYHSFDHFIHFLYEASAQSGTRVKSW